MLMRRQRGKCRGHPNYCPWKIDPYFDDWIRVVYENDHRIRLQRGGSNELYNRQLLCGCCHKYKTQIESVEYDNLDSRDKEILIFLQEPYDECEMVIDS